MERKTVRMTALFKTQAGGRVGSVQDEYLLKLVEVVKEAYQQGKAVAFFVKTWKEGEDPVLSVAVSDKREKRERGPQAPPDPFAGPATKPSTTEDIPF